MKKYFNLKYQSLITILITLIFAISGYYYNQSIPQKWYFKYSIGKTNNTRVYIRYIDSTFNSMKDGGTNVINSFIQDKIYKQAVLNKNPALQNLEITPDLIAFYTEGSLENLNENLDALLSQINSNIHLEIKNYIDSLESTISTVSELNYEIKKDELGVAVEFYNREGIEPVGFTREIINIVDILHTRDDLTQTVRGYLLRLSALLNDLKNTTSIQFLQLDLEKRKKLGNRDSLEFSKIKKIYKEFASHDILKLNGLIEKKNLKPSFVTTSISFAMFGLTLSIFLSLIIGIFSKKINIKKLSTLLNLK
jgi:hypothetical protein